MSSKLLSSGKKCLDRCIASNGEYFEDDWRVRINIQCFINKFLGVFWSTFVHWTHFIKLLHSVPWCISTKFYLVTNPGQQTLRLPQSPSRQQPGTSPFMVLRKVSLSHTHLNQDYCWIIGSGNSSSEYVPSACSLKRLGVSLLYRCKRIPVLPHPFNLLMWWITVREFWDQFHYMFYFFNVLLEPIFHLGVPHLHCYEKWGTIFSSF